jgi:hypothetical protein
MSRGVFHLILSAGEDGREAHFYIPGELLAPDERDLLKSGEDVHFEVKARSVNTRSVVLRMPIPETDRVLILVGIQRGLDNEGRFEVRFNRRLNKEGFGVWGNRP